MRTLAAGIAALLAMEAGAVDVALQQTESLIEAANPLACGMEFQRAQFIAHGLVSSGLSSLPLK
jgi:hypothetical protein